MADSDSLLLGSPERVDAEQLRRTLSAHRYFLTNEDSLQNGIQKVLWQNGISHQREVVLGDAGRIDFLVGRLGIEVKVDGATNAVLRQLMRYATTDQVDELMLVTTRMRHCGLPPGLRGKKLWVVHLLGSVL